MRISSERLGDAFTIVVLFLATSALTTSFIFPMQPQNIVNGSPLMQGVWSCIYVVVLLRAAQLSAPIGRTLRENKILVALVLLAILSSAWSGNPAITIRKSIAIALTTLFAVDFAVRYTLRRQIQFLSIAVGSTIVLSVIAELFLPNIIPKAVFGNNVVVDTAWNGVFSHKSVFGHVLALGTVLVLARERTTRNSYILSCLSLAAILAVTGAVQSRTSLLISLLMICLWPLLTVIHWRPRTMRTLGVVTTLAVAAILYVGFQVVDNITEALDRSTDMTGRTEIWSLSMDSIAKRPMLGYGLSGFWDVAEDADRIRYTVGWDTPYAHSAYIDTTLQLGLVGLTLCALIVVIGLIQGISYTHRLRTEESKFPVACIILSLGYGFTESDFFEANWIFWMIFVSAVCCVSAPVFRPVLPATRFAFNRVVYGER